jgi:hypothetical protein
VIRSTNTENPCGSGLAREGVGTFNIDVTDTPHRGQARSHNELMVAQGNRKQPSRLFFYAYAFWLKPAKRTGR